MTYGNWDAILKQCRDIYLHTRSPYIEHAQSMIDLIPRIRDLFPEVIPITSHAMLCLKLPSSQTEVCVWGQDVGLYEVYLYHPQQNNWSERPIVVGDNIIPVLQNFLKLLQEEKPI